MIVISGALVLLALIFLIAGLAMSGLTLVYVSIGVSVVAGVLLLVGVFTRRPEPVPATAPAGEPPTATMERAEEFTVVTPASGRGAGRGVSAPPAVEVAEAGAAEAGTAEAGAAEAGAAEAGAAEAGAAEAGAAAAEVADAEAADAPAQRPTRRLTAMDLPGGTGDAPAAPETGSERAAAGSAVGKAVVTPVTARTGREPRSVREPRAVPEPEPVSEPARQPAAVAPAAPRTRRSAAARAVVLVVPGRPRYHRDGCRFVLGRADAERTPLAQARASGYSACGVCRPDEPGPAAGQGSAPAEHSDVATAVLESAVAEPARRARGQRSPAAGPDAARATVSPEPVSPEPVSLDAAQAAASPEASAPAATAAASRRRGGAGDLAEAAPVAAASARGARASVVVIPDRDRFHVASCRYVRDAEGTQTLTRQRALRQGFQPCGVCKP